MLKRRNKSKRLSEGRLVAAMISDEVYSYLVLYGIGEETTNSAVLRRQMTNWYKRSRGLKPLDMLICKLVDKAYVEWLVILQQNPQANWEDFLTVMRAHLKKKKLSTIHIQTIIHKLNEKNNQRKNQAELPSQT